MNYVSYTRPEPNSPYSDLSYYGGATGEAVMDLQRNHIRDYADAHSIRITKEYAEQDGDQAFQTLLSDGMGRKFDGVVVDSIDRCGSSLWQAKEVLLETFQYAGISFIVIQDGFNSTDNTDGAEEYFQDKYSDWKKSHMQTESFTKNWESAKKASSAEMSCTRISQAQSPLRGIVYNAKKNKPLKMKTINGVQYFLRSKNIPKHMEGCSLAREDMESLVMDALDREKALAERVLERLKNGEAKELLQYRLSIVGAKMRQEFEILAEAEFAEVEYTKAYENGEISEEEYRRRRTVQQERLLEADRAFQEAQDAGEKIEKSLGFANPWIILMQSWKRPETLDRATVKKYLEKASVRDFKDVEVITKMDRWKKLLPSEWLLY